MRSGSAPTPTRSAARGCRSDEVPGHRLIGALVAVVFGGPLTVALYHDIPPLAHTGGFGEPSCTECHQPAAVEPAPGEFRIKGFPDEYEPGRSYLVTVEVVGEGLQRAGFQAATRWSGGARHAEQAGTWRSSDSLTATNVSDTTGVQYAHQTALGSEFVIGGVARWRLEWTAPAERSGRVVLHAAANLANGDDSEFGDRIIVDSLASQSGDGRATPTSVTKSSPVVSLQTALDQPAAPTATY